MDTAPHERLPQVRLDQPRAPGGVAVPPEYQRDPAADEPAHVPADDQGAGRGDASAVEVAALPAQIPLPRAPPRLTLPSSAWRREDGREVPTLRPERRH